MVEGSLSALSIENSMHAPTTCKLGTFLMQPIDELTQFWIIHVSA